MRIINDFRINKYDCFLYFLIIYLIVINNLRIEIFSLGAVVLGLYFYKKPTYLLVPIFLTSLMGEYFVAVQGVGMSRIFTVMFCIFVFLHNLYQKQKYDSNLVIAILLCSLFFVVSNLRSSTGSILPALTMVLNFVLVFFMYYCDFDQVPIEHFFKVLRVSSIIFVLYLSYSVLNGSASTLSGRLILDEGTNANGLGMALGQLLVLFYAMTFSTEKQNSKIVNITLICVLLLMLILSGSRSALIGVVASILVLSILELKKEKNKTRIILQIFFLLVLSLLLFQYITGSNSLLAERFSIENVLETGGTGREQTWSIIIHKIIPKHPFWGIGFDGANVYYEVAKYTMYPHGTHNIILDIIVQIGFIGGTVFMVWLIWILKKFITDYMNDRVFLAVPLALIIQALGNGIGENVWTTRYFWYAIGIGFLLRNYFLKGCGQKLYDGFN